MSVRTASRLHARHHQPTGQRAEPRVLGRRGQGTTRAAARPAPGHAAVRDLRVRGAVAPRPVQQCVHGPGWQRRAAARTVAPADLAVAADCAGADGGKRTGAYVVFPPAWLAEVKRLKNSDTMAAL